MIWAISSIDVIFGERTLVNINFKTRVFVTPFIIGIWNLFQVILAF